jgi:glycosyltransferase involved in cell wall biosynthesis
MKKPIVHAFFVCYNEANILPHLLKYYLSFCEHVTILDNGSTDNSVDIINSFPNTDVIPFDSKNEFHDGLHIKLKNNVWKSSVGYADYVILGDTDEFLYHENMVDFLIESKEKGLTFFIPEGYHMVADEDFIVSPELNLLEKVKEGVRTPVLDKPMMFDCNKISNINYNFGCHNARPEGNVVVHQHNGLKMLHYKFLGMEDHKYKQKIRAERLSSFNKQHGFGLYYLISEKEQEEDYRSYLNKRIKVF